ncbi:HlyD family efflux transporter periplasmic adaptor subunit [Nitratireductor thuwali]|uniref:Type I secretion system membrane fusion protein PrsE n=1 Tax=Nitratireductor thuwali TaxID=2267699 RepID=A0ABY5MP72_9HYPH|nr:Type I secretion system membrane fusion protein PrsE [Nitratireductor thuwali]
MMFSVKKDRVLLWTIAGLVGAFIVWACIARIDEFARGMGKVVPLGGSQVIQSLEGGILRSLEVEEGARVRKGQELAILDDTSVRAAFEDLQGRSVYLRAAITRIKAELENRKNIEFDPDFEAYQNIVETERSLFEARSRRIRELEEAQTKRLDLVQSELDIAQSLARSGAASQVNVIQLQRSQADMRKEMSEIQNGYYQELATELAGREAELFSVRQQLSQKADVLQRTVLRSPVDGIVSKQHVTTQGGVLAPGQPIMEIVPIGERQLIEAEIDPKDVAFLSAGLEASVKLTAYDYTIFGMLEGKLVYISPDTILDSTRPDAKPYYAVRIETSGETLKDAEGEPLPIIPGMIAEVSIKTSNRRVIASIIKPLLRGTEAFSQR